MKQLFPLICIFILVGCSTTKKATTDAWLLDGTWIPVRQEMAGKVFPPSVYQNQKLILKDSTYTLLAESIDKGTVKYSGNKMDIYGKEGVNAGNHITAVYKLEEGQLSICYDLGGEVYPISYETTGHPVFFMSVFKKEVPK